MIWSIPFLLCGLLFVSDTTSQSILDECLNETLTISESCSARPDQPGVFQTFSATLTKDIAILSLDIWSRNQSRPLYVFEVVMSDYGENVLRMKSYLKFLSIAIRGENITRRSLLFVDEPDGCISQAVKNDTDKTKTKIRDWILCGFTQLGSDGSTVLLIQELCSQSSEVHNDTYLGVFFNSYLYLCCHESTLNQKCIELDKDNTSEVLLDIFGIYSSVISAVFLVMVAMYYFEYPMFQWRIFSNNTENDILMLESKLVNPNCLSLLAMILPSVDSSLMMRKNKYLADGGRNFSLVRDLCLLVSDRCLSLFIRFSLIIIGIVLTSVLYEIVFPYVSYCDKIIAVCTPFVLLLHALVAVVAAKVNNRKYQCKCDLYILHHLIERTLLLIYYLVGYVVLAGSFRILIIQVLSFMVNTQDIKIAGAYCAFLIPFNFQYVKALRKEYTDYLKVCMKTIIKERNEVNIYQHKDGKAMSKSSQVCQKQLFCLENNEYAMHVTAFVKLCKLTVVPCPGPVWYHGFICFLKYLFVDVFVFLILHGLYEFGHVYAASNAVVNVISIITVIALLSGQITVFEKPEKFDGNETDTEQKIIDTFKTCSLKCELVYGSTDPINADNENRTLISQ